MIRAFTIAFAMLLLSGHNLSAGYLQVSGLPHSAQWYLPESVEPVTHPDSPYTWGPLEPCVEIVFQSSSPGHFKRLRALPLAAGDELNDNPAFWQSAMARRPNVNSNCKMSKYFPSTLKIE